MKIKVLMFGVLGDVSGQSELILENIDTISKLKENIFAKFPDLEKYKFRISINQEICNSDSELKNNDEVALLPPFAGG